MKYRIEQPEDDIAVVSLSQAHDGVIISVGDWHIAKILDSGKLMLAAEIPEDNEEGLLVAGTDSVIMISPERF